jgi:ABC-type bacteriocin/lantibiotic exporter with double-glycine peptidase domain
MTFALASIVAEIGRIPMESPYVIDEAFDSLDEQGSAAVLLLACKLAETRQVFLVSHTTPVIAASVGVIPIQLG